MKRTTFFLLLALTGCSDQADQSEGNVATVEKTARPAQPRFDPAKIVFAKAELRKEPKVVDLLFDDRNVVEWEIAVADDGSKRYGYAGYICLKLREFGVYDDDTEVRIIDAAKRAEFKDAFREYSLGAVRCVNEEHFD